MRHISTVSRDINAKLNSKRFHDPFLFYCLLNANESRFEIFIYFRIKVLQYELCEKNLLG